MADVRIQIRHSESGAWDVVKDTLQLEPGEIGGETEPGQCKIGNGTSTWAQLPYVGYASDFDRDVDGGTY